MVFKDSFLIENGFKKTGENSVLSPRCFVQKENILWEEKKREKKSFCNVLQKYLAFFEHFYVFVCILLCLLIVVI